MCLWRCLWMLSMCCMRRGLDTVPPPIYCKNVSKHRTVQAHLVGSSILLHPCVQSTAERLHAHTLVHTKLFLLLHSECTGGGWLHSRSGELIRSPTHILSKCGINWGLFPIPWATKDCDILSWLTPLLQRSLPFFLSAPKVLSQFTQSATLNRKAFSWFESQKAKEWVVSLNACLCSEHTKNGVSNAILGKKELLIQRSSAQSKV